MHVILSHTMNEGVVCDCVCQIADPYVFFHGSISMLLVLLEPVNSVDFKYVFAV